QAELAPDSLDDGPHVYWRNDTTAIVFYLCSDALVTRTYAVDATLRFRGFCADSTIDYTIFAQAPAFDADSFGGVTRIMAISDIHGEFDALADFLKAAGVVDDALHWSWGDGHLVVDGDTFDRGDQVTECLWLFYRLEQEARSVGGRVHVLLGNHETMVLRRDLRYVNSKYLDGIVRRSRIYYDELYGPDMELGRWLRTRNTVVKVNDVLFVHGGMPPELVAEGTSLTRINEMGRANLDLRSYEVAFSDSIKAFYGHTPSGPYWYRGYHSAQENRYPQATEADIDATLAVYGVSAIVVGHTEIDRVESLYGGRVYGIDVPLNELGTFQGLLWEAGRFFRVEGDGSLTALGGG
ncbi:MAG: metallophosphoesterase, partial [Gemmatimonadales bacterium]